MVQHYVSPVYVYKYPFETVMAAYVRRFPRTDRIPVLANTEVIEEETSEDGLLICTKRRCKLIVEAPYIIKRIAGIDYSYFIQENILNWKERTLQICVTNETFSSRVRIEEKCLYTVHGDNEQWTCYDQEANIEFISFFGFETQCERLGLERYTQQIRKGKGVMDQFIQDLLESGDPIPNPHAEYLRSCADSTSSCGKVDSPTPTPATPSLAESAPDPQPAENTAQLNNKRCMRRVKSIDGSKLDADYIQRFLGELTPIQESNLIQLQSLIAASRFGGQMPNDTVLLRFLRAREFNIEKARDMICQHLAWRKQYQVDQIILTWEKPEVIQMCYPGGWHHFDKNGHPVYLLRLGQMDVKGLLESVGEAAITKQLLVFEEEGLKRCESATKANDRAIGTVTLVCDLEGFSMRHFWIPGVNCFDRLLLLFKNNYPETMGKLLFVRAPRIFPLLWALVFPFIDERMREKVFVSCGNDYLDPEGGISSFLPTDTIPDFLGGTCECTFSSGGTVPRNYFADSPFQLDSSTQKACALETLFTTVDITPAKPFEVLIEAASQSVIMWDFDVVRGPVQFSVLHLADQPAASAPSTGSGAPVTGTTTTAAPTTTAAATKAAATAAAAAAKAAAAGGASDADNASSTLLDSSGKSATDWQPCPMERGRGDSSDSCSSIIGSHRAGKVLPFRPAMDEREAELHSAKVAVSRQVYVENENVQDTLAVSSHCGRYLLRWEVSEGNHTPLSTSLSDLTDGGVFRFAGQSRKTTLTYYCEVIPSANVQKASDSIKGKPNSTPCL